MSAILELRSVSKSFRGLKAVKEVSFAVAGGSITGLIGPNGAGKTTLFNIIAGAQKADAGQVLFEGRPIAGQSPDRICRAGIGRTFQLVRPFPALTVEENVLIGALLRTPVAAARRRAQELVALLGLAPKRLVLAASLTLPERKRLELARALATAPKLLLLDEVMAGLRPGEIDEMVALLRRLNREAGLAILLIEHVMRAVMSLSGRILVLHHGELISQGAPDEVAQDPQVLESYLGSGADI
jgi:branched-chain amino acid transport system ATP-binding protein